MQGQCTVRKFACDVMVVNMVSMLQDSHTAASIPAQVDRQADRQASARPIDFRETSISPSLHPSAQR